MQYHDNRLRLFSYEKGNKNPRQYLTRIWRGFSA